MSKTINNIIQKVVSFHRLEKYREKQNKAMGIQCSECEEFGHIQFECESFLRNQIKVTIPHSRMMRHTNKMSMIKQTML